MMNWQWEQQVSKHSLLIHLVDFHGEQMGSEPGPGDPRPGGGGRRVRDWIEHRRGGGGSHRGPRRPVPYPQVGVGVPISARTVRETHASAEAAKGPGDCPSAARRWEYRWGRAQNQQVRGVRHQRPRPSGLVSGSCPKSVDL